MDSPVGQATAGPAGVSVEEFHAAAAGHARYMDERTIDVQVIGPRPFLMMGWMEPHHLVPVIDSFNFLTHQDKLAIFNENPARVIPALAKVKGAAP